ncbi:hypothetical protein [Clostridium ljungdahlii]|uniref:Uncharacterized protein n=1 Tax=Clostridium ljungdahlii TaxID=1538 RepID=A0A170NKU2_9CLOT|nr:hypothetical protein [Clostridium ljungdahlii]OAA91283.1 hypothetical protein WY13_00848 [Clostridium ljungdahlii]
MNGTQVSIITMITAGAAIITAIASAIGVIINIRRDIKSRNKQNEIEEKSQALKISAYLENDEKLYIINSSDLPIYNVVITVIHKRGHTLRKGEDLWKEELALDIDDKLKSQFYNSQVAVYDVIPTGRFKKEDIFPSHSMGDWHATNANRVEISFTDSSSNSWIKRADGKLEKIEVTPYDYYDLCETNVRKASLVEDKK